MMDQLNTADKFKVVLELITKIPEFSGNSNCLVDFLATIDALIPTLITFEAESLVILSGYIKDKIVGNARCELQKHGNINEWTEIRQILINRFGEKESVNSLIDKIRTSRVITNICKRKKNKETERERNNHKINKNM